MQSTTGKLEHCKSVDVVVKWFKVISGLGKRYILGRDVQAEGI